mgnify:FL=1
MDKEHHFDPLMKIQAMDFIIKQELTDRAYRVFCFLVFRYNTYTQQCNPSIEYMAKEMGKSPSYVKRGLQELRKRKFISNRRGSLTTGSNLYCLEGTSIGIFEPQGSNVSYQKVKSVTHEGSEVSRKYINEDIKENINIDTHYEPEQPEGSGSSGISDQERKKAGDIISKTILEAMN